MPVCERELLEANVPALALSENEVEEDHDTQNISQNNKPDRRPATGTRTGRGRTNRVRSFARLGLLSWLVLRSLWNWIWVESEHERQMQFRQCFHRAVPCF